jgi:hypothetical protein
LRFWEFFKEVLLVCFFRVLVTPFLQNLNCLFNFFSAKCLERVIAAFEKWALFVMRGIIARSA